MIKGKSYRQLLRIWGEPAQVCGTSGAANQPQIAELPAPYLIRERQHYFYKFIAGNNKPSIYGSQFASGESVDVNAEGWLGVPALRAQRWGGKYDVNEEVDPFNGFGATNVYRKHEVNLNPLRDCAGDDLFPTVITS